MSKHWKEIGIALALATSIVLTCFIVSLTVDLVSEQRRERRERIEELEELADRWERMGEEWRAENEQLQLEIEQGRKIHDDWLRRQ